MPTAYAKRSTEDLISTFAKAATEHGEFMAACDPKRANAKFDQMAKLYGELRQRGLDAKRQLLPLLGSDNPHVRFHVATYALDFEPEQAVQALKKILQMESGGLRFDARMTLEQWQKGEIRFSWVPGEKTTSTPS